jgi:hypothetical protein
MRLAVTLAGVVILCLVGLISVIDGTDVLPKGSALVVGVIVFCSCVTGMMIVHIDRSYENAQRTAGELSRANLDLEVLVDERARRLSEKVAPRRSRRTRRSRGSWRRRATNCARR